MYSLLLLLLPYRQGSVIADMELTFNETVGENQVDALLSQATNDGKLGKLEVSEVKVGTTIKGQFFCLDNLLFFHSNKFTV